MSADIDRFVAQMAPPDENGCRKWLGSYYSNGYGKAYLSRARAKSTGYARITGAHRVAYLFLVGPLEAGKVILHQCDNRWCVEPSHLSQGSQQENIDDMLAKGRWKPYERVPRTHCKRGHEYRPESTYIRNGHKGCRICRRARERARYWASKEGAGRDS